MMRGFQLSLLFALALAACHSSSSSSDDDSDAGADADTDADTDVDADSDADACMEGAPNWEDIGDCGPVPDDEATDSLVASEQGAWLGLEDLPCDDPDELVCYQGFDNFVVVVSGDAGLAAVNESIAEFYSDFEPVEADFESQRVMVFGGTIVICGDYGQYSEDLGVEYEVFEWPDGRLHFEAGIWVEPLNYFPEAEGFYLTIGAILVVDTDQNPTVCLSL